MPLQQSPGPGKVLLVDDSTDILLLFEIILRDHYEVRSATSVDDALEMVRSWRPDVVLTDLILPGKSGLDLITAIRSDIGPPLPSIGAISGFPDLEPEALRRGASAFRLKPCDAPGLLRLVESLLGGAGALPEHRAPAVTRRREAMATAEEMLRVALERSPALPRMADRAALFLSRYFEGATTVFLLFRNQALRVLSSSRPDRFAAGTPVDGPLSYAADVIESGASLVIPNAAVLSALERAHGVRDRLLVCTPFLSPGGVPIGGLALLDDTERSFDAADLAIVEHIARRSAEVLASTAAGPVSGAVLRPDTWRLLLNHEIGHLRQGCALGLGVVDVRSTEFTEAVDDVLFGGLSSRMALGELSPGQLGLFKLGQDIAGVRDTVETMLRRIGRALGIRAAGALLVSGLEPPEPSAALLSVAESIQRVATRRGEGAELFAMLAPAAVERR